MTSLLIKMGHITLRLAVDPFVYLSTFSYVSIIECISEQFTKPIRFTFSENPIENPIIVRY